jgi:Protein of unknown function (DUF3108)
MMKNLMFGTSFFVMVIGFMAFKTPPFSNQTPPLSDPCYAVNTTFQGGEELTYKLYYNWNAAWVAAGEVTFKVQDEGSLLHVSAEGRTYRSYEWFYKVNDRYDTYLDKSSMLPVVSERDVAEGKYRLYDKVVFNQATHQATSYRGKTKASAQKSEYDVKECMHDILSVIYYMRNIDTEKTAKGAKIPIKVFMDGEAFPLNVKYKGKQNYVALRDMGHYNTIKLSPQVVNGRVFKDGSEVNVYASDDANKIPLLIESPLSVGSLKAVLKSYKGLRYPFTAKVD